MARHINFSAIKVVSFESSTQMHKFSSGRKLVWCLVNVA